MKNFKLVFDKMYDISIFEKYGLKPVSEDYYKIKENCFCIADGVTRDTINGTPAKKPTNEQEAKEWIKEYPYPSGAYEAAKIIADSFIDEISKIEENEITEQKIKQAVIEANNKVAKINNKRKIDYVKEDYYCCVAVGGYITDDTLYAFSIGDCHISLFDEEYNLLFTTINNHKWFEDYEKNHDFDWSDPNVRKLIRSEYRNNPTKKENGKDITFGVLSGEKNAEYYIDTYKVDLKKVKYICAYSDGCENAFSSKEKVIELLKNPIILEKEQPERTLIIYEKIKNSK